MNTTDPHPATSAPPLPVWRMFALLWVLMFLLYLPAAKAGFVSDFTGWLDQIRNHSFSEYINRTNFGVVSLYQFTQLVTWIFYKLFGVHAWLWHLLFITLHAANATLLYRVVGTMLNDAGVKAGKAIARTGALLFCVTPAIAEVVVWEPSFHYLQGMLLVLLILRQLQQYFHTPAAHYARIAAALYFLSLFSLEIFYLTPWLVLSLAGFYKYVHAEGKVQYRKAILLFFIPMLLLFAGRMVGFRLYYGDWVSRIGSNAALLAPETGLGKPMKYLCHLLIPLRYLPGEWHAGALTMAAIRKSIYQFCDSTTGIVLFYGVNMLVLLWYRFRYRYVIGHARAVYTLLIWTLLCLLLVTPLPFGDLLLIIYDRYSYFAAPFLFMLTATLIYSIKRSWLRKGWIVFLLLINLRYAVQAARYWGKGQRITDALLHHLPDNGCKTTLLLNLPDSMHGAAMIGSAQESEYALMRRLLTPELPLCGKVYDVMSYNMASPEDGANVTVVNDSTVHVALNQWATWWWYAGFGGHDYETADYHVHIRDGYYKVILTHAASDYALYYQKGDEWKRVDMARRDTQF